MTQKFDCKFYLGINEDGGFVVHSDGDAILEKLAEDEGGYHAQVYEVTLKVAGAKPLAVTAELPEAPDEPVEIAAKVAE